MPGHALEVFSQGVLLTRSKTESVAKPRRKYTILCSAVGLIGTESAAQFLPMLLPSSACLPEPEVSRSILRAATLHCCSRVLRVLLVVAVAAILVGLLVFVCLFLFQFRTIQTLSNPEALPVPHAAEIQTCCHAAVYVAARHGGVAHYIMGCLGALGALSDAPDDASISSSSLAALAVHSLSLAHSLIANRSVVPPQAYALSARNCLSGL